MKVTEKRKSERVVVIDEGDNSRRPRRNYTVINREIFNTRQALLR
jgi:hypothetical protein